MFQLLRGLVGVHKLLAKAADPLPELLGEDFLALIMTIVMKQQVSTRTLLA